MSPEQAKWMVDRIELKNSVLGGAQLTVLDDLGGISIRLDYRAPDRDTGRTTDISGLYSVKGYELAKMDAPRLLDFVRDCVEKAFLHEMRECFIVAGVRVLDPHATTPVAQPNPGDLVAPPGFAPLRSWGAADSFSNRLPARLPPPDAKGIERTVALIAERAGLVMVDGKWVEAPKLTPIGNLNDLLAGT